MIPSLAVVRIHPSRSRGFGLWLPLFLLWIPVILLSPLILLVLLVVCLVLQISFWRSIAVFWGRVQLAGNKRSRQSRRNQVRFEFSSADSSARNLQRYL